MLSRCFHRQKRLFGGNAHEIRRYITHLPAFEPASLDCEWHSVSHHFLSLLELDETLLLHPFTEPYTITIHQSPKHIRSPEHTEGQHKTSQRQPQAILPRHLHPRELPHAWRYREADDMDQRPMHNIKAVADLAQVLRRPR